MEILEYVRRSSSGTAFSPEAGEPIRRVTVGWPLFASQRALDLSRGPAMQDAPATERLQREAQRLKQLRWIYLEERSTDRHGERTARVSVAGARNAHRRRTTQGTSLGVVDDRAL